jgi:flagellar biosynthesis protein FlhF
MKLIQFIADDAATALAQIHAQLGDLAVVVSVKSLPADGLAKLWPGKRRIEVMAGVPVSAGERSCQVAPFRTMESRATSNAADSSQLWSSVTRLVGLGLLSEHAGRLQAHLGRLHGHAVPASPEGEWSLVRSALAAFWRRAPTLEENGFSRPHVFIGPPGSGKTTALCKWLTLALLTEAKSAQVWRLDSQSANTAEFLTIHCEMLGVPLERFWSPPVGTADLLFVDLPGVEVTDAAALTALRAQIATFPTPRVHLVLNAAYETSGLLSQWQVFAPFAPEDIIFTHVDEAGSLVKLWNFQFGTNCTVRFLSGGQKIPGDFRPATPELFLPA